MSGPGAVFASLAVAAAAAGSPATPPPEPLGERIGGDATVPASGRTAFSFPFTTLSNAELARFSIGNSFFRRNWVEAPSSTTARDGLGPHFIARSCSGCHVLDGRGAPPEVVHGRAEQPVALVLQLSVPGRGDHGSVVPEPVYGDRFTTSSVQGVRPEGRVAIRHRTIEGRFADGTPYTLRQPLYRVENLGYGPMAGDVMMSPRIAPQLPGVGLIEAIAEAEILGNAAAQASLPGPIKGRPNQVWDAASGKMRLGRFGWKANVATLAQQTAAAFQGDIGITSSLRPQEACTPSQKDCLAAPSGGKGGATEIDDATFGDVVFYLATLAPAAQRDVASAAVRQGQALFERAQCAACHRPSYSTGEPPSPQMSSPSVTGRRIRPYTDLLLHDMGEGLADRRPDFEANGRQWKTPPLWGIGLIRDVNGHQRLLHDGRANGVLEAVLWHGGEAEASKQALLKMSRREREALLRFVESL